MWLRRREEQFGVLELEIGAFGWRRSQLRLVDGLAVELEPNAVECGDVLVAV